jgi:hypothetical protein
VKNLDTPGCLAWAQQLQIVRVGRAELRYSSGLNEVVEIGYPQKPSNIIPKVLTIAGRDNDPDDKFAGALFWVTDFNIWPDDQEQVSLDLFNKLRNVAPGSFASLEDSPGILFDEGELKLQREIMLVPLVIGWDAYFIPLNKDYFVYICHDEIIEVVCHSESAAALWREVAKGNEAPNIPGTPSPPEGTLRMNLGY